ncbi:hypothetical protein [Agaribacter flavus]|uniref:CBM-cenC domain-containing protein n=1 Tax=Agaribacter flavus TaxID=1902781 RepID=A0ABV7FUB7_9ALTE
MKFKYKNLLVPAVITALYGCGSGTDNEIVRVENNSPPVLDPTALVVEGLSSTYLNDNEQLEWEFRFKESEDKFPDLLTSSSDPVDFFDIDLLTGISDADNASVLRVEKVQFVWQGPDCSLTATNSVNYPEICNPIYEALGFLDEEGNVINTTPAQDLEIRELQNLPVTNGIIYGFELFENFLRVTPTEFEPILVTGETSQLHMAYVVTDGETEVARRLKVIIDGEDEAPQFIQLDSNGDPILDPDTGESMPIDQVMMPISEKSSPITFNIIEGIFDQDIEDVQDLILNIGALENTYQPIHYQIERLNVIGMTPPEGLPAGVFNDSNSTRVWTEERGIIEYNVTVDPSPYADLLERGDNVELEFKFQVTDGTNFVDRSFFVTIKGADLFNPPEFEEPVLTQSLQTSGEAVTFNLKEGVLDLDGDPIEIIDFTPAEGSTGFGVDLSNPNAVRVDPYGFLNLAPGEEKVLSYTYRLTDGGLTSDERELRVVLTGANPNLFHVGNPDSNGFEGGSLDGTAFSGDTSILSVTSEAAYSGEYGLNNAQGGTFLELEQEGIEQGKIEEGDDYYINFFAKQSAAWGGARVTFNKNADAADSFQIETSPTRGTADWFEHTLTYVNADEFFQTDSIFDLTFRLDQGSFDDFSMVKYEYTRARDLVSEGQFSQGVAGGWQVIGDGTLAVTEEANRVQNVDDLQYGLEVTAGPEGAQLILDSSQLLQGAVKPGMRYIVQFDLRNPSYSDPAGANPSVINVRIVDENGSAYVRKAGFAEASATAWNTYAYHLNTVSVATDWQGTPYAYDPEFDWENADVQLQFDIPAGQTFQLDNIRMFPVPQ